MMKRLIPFVAVAALFGTAARANPITDKVLKLRQVPHTTHVQITYGVDPNYIQITDPKELKRDDDILSPTWTTYDSFTANTGSGLVDLSSVQFCDCDVPVGERTYAVTVEGYGGDETYSMPVTVVADLGDLPDAGVVDPDAAPWDIPEPIELQGLDCTAACTAVVNPDAGPYNPDAGDQPSPVDRQGGCSLAPDPGVTLLSMFLGVLLLLGLRRRRRR